MAWPLFKLFYLIFQSRIQNEQHCQRNKNIEEYFFTKALQLTKYWYKPKFIGYSKVLICDNFFVPKTYWTHLKGFFRFRVTETLKYIYVFQIIVIFWFWCFAFHKENVHLLVNNGNNLMDFLYYFILANTNASSCKLKFE
jgi:hypothetical protein